MQWQSAKCYSSEASRFQWQSGYEFLQQLSPARGSTVLDLGCGTGCLADIVEFFFGMMQGEKDQAAITEKTVQACREKYDDDLHREAELHLKTRVLHVVLTKQL